MESKKWTRKALLFSLSMLCAGHPRAGLLGGLLGGGGGTSGSQAIEPVGLGYDEKTQSTGGQGQLTVVPKSEGCMDNGNGTYTATWGYFNMNNYTVSIPVGARNKLYPGNANQGQPTSFLSGEKTSVFSTTYAGSELTWILDGRTASVQSCNCVAACPFHDSLLEETWDSFNPALWQGDGDQTTSGGYFLAKPLAFSAFADWRNAAPVAVEPNAVVHFDQTFRLTYPLIQVMAQSGILYQVNKDKDGTFTDYAFVNIGYTGLPDNKLFVELFGADGGVGFDQFEVTDIAAAPDKTLKVDLRISDHAYQVAVDGVVVNTVALVNALPQVDLFNVGVQRNLIGLEGRIDASYIYKTCK